MASITLEQILNFIIPMAVALVLVWIIYKIPPIKDLVDTMIQRFRDWREGRSNDEGTKIKTITYE